ncbi:MAG: hypothetical protein ACYDAD_00115 [Acidimicrobiales bacterium]
MHAVGAVAAVAVCSIVASELAWASFSSVTSASMPVSTATLAAPTNPGAATSACASLDAASIQVKVSWTPTTSTFADGYQILRSGTVGGPYSLVTTVAGQPSTSGVDRSGTLQFSQTYFYVVQAAKATNWTSPNSTEVTYNSPSLLCG